MTMFIGNNELVLNHATLKQAVEHYLNSRVLMSSAAIEVISVTSQLNGSEFSVKVTPKAKEQPEDPTR